VERRRAPTHIDVYARRDGNALVLGVADDAGKLAASERPGGIGLANLRARIQALYGDAGRLDITARPQGGVRAELRVPCAS
jgi:LytS/YehU family sensor histidine kinase